VAQVLEHAILDQGIWAAAVGDVEPPAGNAFAPTGALPADIARTVATAVQNAAQAWASVAPDATGVPTPLPQGVLDPITARNAAALDAAVHAWDIAVAIGAAQPLDDQLAAQLLPTAQQIVEPLRQWGAYATALPEVPGDAASDALLRYLGRDPRWMAGSR
jgi:uncharacterized protein (TIGR03086 family)